VCGDLRWWCRGCGGYNKIEAFIDSGFCEDDAEMIKNFSFESCSKPHVPGFLCNKDEGEFWSDFIVISSQNH